MKTKEPETIDDLIRIFYEFAKEYTIALLTGKSKKIKIGDKEDGKRQMS